MLYRDWRFMAICKRYLKIAYTVTGPKQALMTRLRCKQWSCEYCADKNARTWQYWLIKRLPEVSQDWYFVTLTASPDTRTTIASLHNIRSNIDRLIKRVRRVFGKEHIQYARTFELHPTSDAVHVHFIMTGLTPYVVNGFSVKHRPMSLGVLTRKGRSGTWTVQTWFKKTCQALGMGYIADVQHIEGDTAKVAFYVTKYLTKEQGRLNMPYLRHVQVTQGIGSPEFEENHTWTPVSYITSTTFTEPNTRVLDLDTGFTVDNNWWEHTGFYPNDPGLTET